MALSSRTSLNAENLTRLYATSPTRWRRGLNQSRISSCLERMNWPISRTITYFSITIRLSAHRAGVAYKWNGFLFTLDGFYGSGLRSGFANTGNQPFYIQFNAGIVKRLTVPSMGNMEARVAVVNLGDWIYQLRSGSGIGVFAPQYGIRRTVYAGLKWYLPWTKPSSMNQIADELN